MGHIFLRSGTYVLIMGMAMLLRRKNLFEDRDRVTLSRLSVYVTLPCALISGFDSFVFESSFLSIVIFGFVVNLIIVLITLLLKARTSRLEQATYFLNTSSYNIGSFAIPFSYGLFPTADMATLIMFDIGNGVYSLGVNNALAQRHVSKHKAFDGLAFVKTLMKSPALVVYLSMLVLYGLNIKLPPFVYTMTKTIGSANVVVIMAMFGLMMGQKTEDIFAKKPLKIVTMRYLISAGIALVFWYVAPFKLVIKQLVVLSLMTPMTSLAPVFCHELGSDPKDYGSVISISILLSIVISTVLLAFWGI